MKRVASITSLMVLTAAQAGAIEFRPANFQSPSYAEVELGWLLFYDPILSGNKNISCATCHHPRFGTADGVALSLGEGGTGLGPDRVGVADNMPEQRIPRNAPALFNLGADEFQVMFHDGRLEADASKPNGIRTPLGADMVMGFDSVLSAQAMFPVLSPDEMAGHYSENEISQAVRLGQLSGPGGAWDLIAKRVNDIPEYRTRFDDIIGADRPVTFPDVANVLADFIVVEWRADQSPFDKALTGQAELAPAAQRGQELFYGDAACSSCHAGRFQTDHEFHAIGLPQFGPGKAARFESHVQDTGRARVTGKSEDFYAFRTPSLRNITLTAPYGHTGAFTELEDMVQFHVEAITFDPSQVILPDFSANNDWAALEDSADVAAISAARDLPEVALSDNQIDDLLAFLDALTDETWRTKGLGIPEAVPSGLSVDR